MRFLGVLVFLFGIALWVVHFAGASSPATDWVNNWGETPAMAIRFGFVLVGFVMMILSGKKKN